MHILDQLDKGDATFQCRNPKDVLALGLAKRLYDEANIQEYATALDQLSTDQFLSKVKQTIAQPKWTPAALRSHLLTE
ncbi:MAG: hypothetical protein JWO13_428 [Acidobacteriales bacterium]|nr:hypothetical protein [Terriglobales bacterium]